MSSLWILVDTSGDMLLVLNNPRLVVFEAETDEPSQDELEEAAINLRLVNRDADLRGPREMIAELLRVESRGSLRFLVGPQARLTSLLED